MNILEFMTGITIGDFKMADFSAVLENSLFPIIRAVTCFTQLRVAPAVDIMQPVAGVAGARSLFISRFRVTAGATDLFVPAL